MERPPNTADWEYVKFRDGCKYIWLDVPGERVLKELIVAVCICYCFTTGDVEMPPLAWRWCSRP